MARSLGPLEMLTLEPPSETDTDPDAEREWEILLVHGWEQCYWCWEWDRQLYAHSRITHSINGWGPLCINCVCRLMNGGGPPWNPNNLQRCEEWLRRMVAPGQPAVLECMIPELARCLADPNVP